MRQYSDMHGYQLFNVRHVIENKAVQIAGGSGLILEMGLGKTITILTAFVEMKRRGMASRMIIIAPHKVAQTVWQNEIRDWAHVNHLRYAEIMGPEKKRKAALARNDVDFWIMNVEQTQWLVAYLEGRWPFDFTVLDESGAFKNPKSKRFRALKLVHLKMNRVVCLTGTFAPQTLLELWPQMYLMDKGVRLGKTLNHYREKYFRLGDSRQAAQYGIYVPKGPDNDLEGEDVVEKEILNKISDICVSMKSRDWLQLPDMIDVDRSVMLSPEILKAYKKFERDTVLNLPADGDTISATNIAALRTKLLQFSNGAVYREDGVSYVEVHKEKLIALEEMVEAQNGNPLLVFYRFKSDVVRIKEHLKSHKPHVYTGTNAEVEAWNKKQYPVMIMYPTYGVNLQYGGRHLAWFGMPDAYLLYTQANARLHRQGQIEKVIKAHLRCPGTVEDKVVQNLIARNEQNESVMEALKAIIREHRE